MGIKSFDYDAEINYVPEKVAEDWSTDEWPDYPDEDGIMMPRLEAGSNREFLEFVIPSFEISKMVCDIESKQLDVIESGQCKFSEVIEEEENAIESGSEYEFWLDFDLGVRGAVLAISSIGGFPFTSCNAGSFIEDTRPHNESHHPTIAFYCRRSSINIIEEIARKNQCGLRGYGECLVMGTGHIRNFSNFAIELLETAIARGMEDCSPDSADSTQTQLFDY